MLESVKQLLSDHGSGGLFSALSIFPKATKFEAQDEEEKIVLLLRPHFATNIWWIILGLLMSVVPQFWIYIPVVSLLPENYLLVLTLFWYALTLTFVFERFLMWFFSVNIVTDERVIDVDFYGLLFKHVGVASINKIEDVNYYQKGIMGAAFNFGDVLIQTAAEIPEFVFNKVPNPEKVVKVLSELIAEEEREAIDGRVR
ncbi:PH domain-containing protein [Candidatus Collierbacteria bacterium]|nr:PH domain-containing protein [Candidatus Collierbacteria bacterium]